MPKRILIIKPSALGDVALTLGAISTLRTSFPEARITWFVRREFAPLLEGHSDLDEIMIFDRKLLGKWWYQSKAFAELVRLIKKLIKGKFDLVFDLQGLFRTALFSWITGSKKRFGMSSAREFAGIFYTDRIPCDDDNINLMDYYNKIIVAAGARNEKIKFKLAVSSQADKQVVELLKKHGIQGNNYAVLVPGAAHQYKCWPGVYYACIAEQLKKRFGLPVLAVGTAAEKALVEKIASICDQKVINLCGQTNIPQLVSLLSRAGFVLTNDTGPGHIAAVASVPMVMVFGVTNPLRVGPYKRLDCVAAVAAFERDSDIESTYSSHAIDNVTVEEVLEKIDIQLGRHHGAAGPK
jgi:lipopolysaccharide heptosyltransferase I